MQTTAWANYYPLWEAPTYTASIISSAQNCCTGQAPTYTASIAPFINDISTAPNCCTCQASAYTASIAPFINDICSISSEAIEASGLNGDSDYPDIDMEKLCHVAFESDGFGGN